MPARDHYTLAVKCPKCGVKGTAKVSEDDHHPWMRDLGFQVDELPPGFRLGKKSVYRKQTEVFCAVCNVRVDL
jgi:uncharacterized Zn finger protein (UPF0148 family)